MDNTQHSADNTPMASTLGDQDRLRVSPYLEEVAMGSIPSFTDRVEGLRPGQQERYAALGDAGALRLLYSFLSDSFVVVEADDFALLVGHAASPFVLAGASPADRARLRRLATLDLVMTESAIENAYRFRLASIEINSHCNYRCVFCPVATDPLPKRLMDPALYQQMIERVAAARIPTVCLNHYGEPSLDPRLVERVRVARDHGLTVDLYSNLSRLGEAQLRELAALANINMLVVNLPSVDAAEFERATEWKRLDAVLANVKTAAELGLPVRIALNLPAHASVAERRAARDELARRTGIHTTLTRMHSRAGNLDNPEYVTQLSHRGLLNGCFRKLTEIAISVDGKAFLCCQDYRQHYLIGDLREQSIDALAAGPRAVELRRWVFGLEESPADFICRKCDKTCSRPAEPTTLSMGAQPIWDWPEAGTPGWKAFHRSFQQTRVRASLA